MISAAKAAGTLGYKINGSGYDGTMIAYAQRQEQAVAAAIKSAAGHAYTANRYDGVSIEA